MRSSTRVVLDRVVARHVNQNVTEHWQFTEDEGWEYVDKEEAAKWEKGTFRDLKLVHMNMFDPQDGHFGPYILKEKENSSMQRLWR